MKTEQEIRDRIKTVIASSKHVLDCGMATIDINAPRALIQLSARAQLDALYWALGEERPQFKCDDLKTKNT